MEYTSVRPSSSQRTSDSVSSMPIISRMRSLPSIRQDSMPGIHPASPPKSRTTFHTSSADWSMSISFVAVPMTRKPVMSSLTTASRARRDPHDALADVVAGEQADQRTGSGLQAVHYVFEHRQLTRVDPSCQPFLRRLPRGEEVTDEESLGAKPLGHEQTRDPGRAGS